MYRERSPAVRLFDVCSVQLSVCRSEILPATGLTLCLRLSPSSSLHC